MLRDTKLKYLTLNSVDMLTDDYKSHVIYNPTESLQSLSSNDVQWFRGHQVEEETKRWLSYIGQKYLQLRNLDLNLSFDMDQKDLLRKSLTTVLGNLKYLNRYSVDICAIKQPILDAMKANGVQLTHFGFPADAYEGDDPIEEI